VSVCSNRPARMLQSRRTTGKASQSSSARPKARRGRSLAFYQVDHQYPDHNTRTAINVFGLATTSLDQRLSADGGLDFWIL
jgi:hypothetical protein